MMKIESKQIQLIHIARAQLGLTDEDYRAIISGRSEGKKESSSDLTYHEADAVINYMIRLGFKIKPKYVAREKAVKHAWKSGQRPANVFCLATQAQLNMINALAGKIQWRYADGYDRWRRKYIKIDQIRTDDEAMMVIEGLKGMLQNQDGDCDF
jgi:phage gp16-like protein